MYIFIHQPPRNTWQTDLVEVHPVWLEVRPLFGSILGNISPHNTNFRVSHPTVNTAHPPPGFLRGDAPSTGSRALHHSDQASLSTPAEVSTTLKISDIIAGLENLFVRPLAKWRGFCLIASAITKAIVTFIPWYESNSKNASSGW